MSDSADNILNYRYEPKRRRRMWTRRIVVSILLIGTMTYTAYRARFEILRWRRLHAELDSLRAVAGKPSRQQDMTFLTLSGNAEFTARKPGRQALMDACFDTIYEAGSRESLIAWLSRAHTTWL